MTRRSVMAMNDWRVRVHYATAWREWSFPVNPNDPEPNQGQKAAFAFAHQVVAGGLKLRQGNGVTSCYPSSVVRRVDVAPPGKRLRGR